jgi:adenine specific DNA methylase Mod
MSQNLHVNLEQRILELEEENRKLKLKTKYGLVWEEKQEDVVKNFTTKYPILIQDEKRKLSLNKDKGNNILIEGDNYHSLSVLSYTHKNKIDVIYIDPPYNTGNKDFIYNDDYVDRDDSYRYSKWLSFMERRLKLAHDLLADNGLIFISIDDNQHSQLKLLCDSIFGYKNYVNNFIWINNLKGRQISDYGASKTYEYILCYAKKTDQTSAFEGDIENLKKICPEVYKNKNYEIFEDSYGQYVLKNELYNSNSDFNEETRPNLVFDIYYNPKSKEIKFKTNSSDKGFVKIEPKKNNNGKHKYHAWRWGKDKIQNEPYNLEFVEDDSEYFIYTKVRNVNTTNIKDLITNISTNAGGKDIRQIFGTKKFSFPKPIDLIVFLLRFSTHKNSTILDFMAGSGTTGHAVLRLNNEDNGNRKFILCTNNENKICEDVTYLRFKKILTKNQNSTGESFSENLTYLKCDFIDRTRHSDNMKMRLMRACTEMLCLKENTFQLEKEVNYGDTLMYKIFSGMKVENGIVKKHVVGIYYDLDDSCLDDMRADLKSYGDLEKTAYIFSLRNVDDFIDDYRKWKGINIEEIPQKILEIYEAILKNNSRNK